MLSGATVPDILLGNNLLHSPDSYQGVLLGIRFGALPQTPWPLCLFEVPWPLKLLPPDLTSPSHLAPNLFPLGSFGQRGEESHLASVCYCMSGVFFLSSTLLNALSSYKKWILLLPCYQGGN